VLLYRPGDKMRKIYIDCDGVILDSITNLCLQKEKLGLYNHIDPDEFYKFGY